MSTKTIIHEGSAVRVVTEELPLFEPLSANADPISSFEVAEQKKETINRQALIVLESLKKHSGVCSKELSDLSGLDRIVCARRLPNLRSLGYAQNCPRPCDEAPCKQGRNNDSCPSSKFKKYKGAKQILWFVREK
jgi:hypothetical protein